jgi:choline dehydrogenase
VSEDATPTGNEVDFIVVGSGSAGAAAAARLVEREATVLLIEAGGPCTNPAIHDPGRMHELWDSEVDWGYRTTPQAAAGGRRLHLPRGRVLGGSSCLNGMIYTRGAPHDYDSWVAQGAAGWGWEDVLPVYRRMEDFDSGPSELHGAGGPVRVMTQWEPDPIQVAIIEAAQQAGLPLNSDYNSTKLDGVSQMQFTISKGRRHSAVAAYLDAIEDEPGLQVVTDATVTRLLLDGERCTGVEWARNGALEQASVAAEVVVCGGAIGSPQLLLCSGIGPADELAGLGIEVAHDLPGVGANLHDHLLSPVIFSAERQIDPPTAGLPAPQSHSFWRSRPGLPGPDTQPIHFSAPLYEDWMEGPENGFSLMAGMISPQSRGRLRLSDADPTSSPLIDLAALSETADLESLAASVAMCRRIGAEPALREWGSKEIYPGPEVSSDASLHDYVRSTAITYHHQVGTCRMGSDDLAVVDPELRVRGLDSLRVADASVMPTVISGNTQAPAIMIGERVADFITSRSTADEGARVAG